MTLRDTRTGKTFHAEFRSNWYTITILVVTETGECIPLADYPYTVVVEATPKERVVAPTATGHSFLPVALALGSVR